MNAMNAAMAVKAKRSRNRKFIMRKDLDHG